MQTATVAPTPAVVLGLGSLGAEMAAEVERIFLSGDRRREAVTRFLALTSGGAEGPTFVPVREESQRGGGPAPSRREACQLIVAGAPRLRAQLEGVLHDMRTQERLIEAGLGDVLTPPLDIIVVADLTETEAAGALIPLAYMLQALLAHEPQGMGHLLLSTARFNATDETDEAQLYAVLKELDALADPERASAAGPLAQALGLEEVEPLPFRLYLFDHRKEGTWEVKDGTELRVILGNFLLALLSGGLAQRLGYGLPLPEMLERRAFYSSGAATALVFEPQPLIEACAARMGAEFIAAEMGPDAVPDPRLADELANEMEGNLGDLRDWLERLCADMPYETWADDDGLHLGLHFTGFRFERICKEDWDEAIASYDALFGRVKLPRYQGTMEENAEALAEEVLARQAQAIEALPQAARLYPGGLRTARRALKKLDERLEDRIEVLSTGEQTAPLREEADLEALERAAWNFPDLPAFIARLVLLCVVEAYAFIALGSGLRRWLPAAPLLGWFAALLACGLTVGACALWLRRKDGRLIALRERCIRNSEQKYSALLEGAAREQLIALCEKLRAQIAEGLEALKELEAKLKEVGEKLAGRWDAFPQADSLFRPSPVDGAFADWAYRRWRQPPEEMRRPFLEEHRFLAGWREAAAEELTARLLAYGREVFAPVKELSLEDVLRHRGEGDAEALLLALTQGAVPLLRPNFDRLGGGGYAHGARYILVADPRASAFAPLLEGPLAEWEVVTTGDPYIAACCQVRHLIPLAALRALTRRGRKAYENMEPEERRALHLFDEWAELPDS